MIPCGRRLERYHAPRPLRVITTAALMFKSEAIWIADAARCCPFDFFIKFFEKFTPGKLSVRSAIRFKVSTERTGYFPMEVSPESIIESDYSKTAFATSVTSALVGTGCSIIDSSICVATIKRFPNFAHRKAIFL